jgi:hypothetical protein
LYSDYCRLHTTKVTSRMRGRTRDGRERRPRPRAFPEHLPPVVYSSVDAVRTGDVSDRISFRSRLFRVGQAFRSQQVALCPTESVPGCPRYRRPRGRRTEPGALLCPLDRSTAWLSRYPAVGNWNLRAPSVRYQSSDSKTPQERHGGMRVCGTQVGRFAVSTAHFDNLAQKGYTGACAIFALNNQRPRLQPMGPFWLSHTLYSMRRIP